MSATITDPELDLLSELVEDDPGASAFLQVGRGLLERERTGEALRVLQAGIDATDDDGDRQQGLRLLAEAAFAAQQDLLVLSTLSKLEPLEEGLRRLELLALARAGRSERFLGQAIAWLEGHEDPEIEKLARRLARSGNEPLAGDPLVSEVQAERHVEAGDLERAVRIYRRLRFRRPDDDALRSRLAEVEALQRGDEPSVDTGRLLLPLIATPSLGANADEEITSPTVLASEAELARAIAREKANLDAGYVEEPTVRDDSAVRRRARGE